MNRIVNEARKHIGKQFRHHGRGPNAFDCAGLCKVAVESATGRVLDDVRYYGREPHRDGLRSALVRNFGEPVTDAPMPGDVLLIRYTINPHHLAIVGGSGYGELTIIHASGDRGRVVEERLDSMWQSRIVAVYRPEVT